MGINNFLYGLSLFLDTSNGYDTLHQRRVALIAYKIAEAMNFDETGRKLVLQSGFIHDIGLLSEISKIETFRQIIDENFKKLNKHAAAGYKISRFLNLHLDVSNAINLHHTPSEFNPAMMGNILFLADNIEVSYRSLTNPFAFNEIYDFLRQKKKLFNNDVFEAFRLLAEKENFWYSINEKNLDRELIQIIETNVNNRLDAEVEKRSAYLVAYVSDHLTPFFHGYSILTKNISTAAGYKLSLDLNKLTLASLFSHMGNVFIPIELLNTPASLNDVEYNIIKSHTYYTGKLLSVMGVDKDIRDRALLHHENLQGNGYPCRRKEFDKNIQVIQLSTILSALLQDRPYRTAYSYDEAKDVLRTMDFDKDVADTALNLDLKKIASVKDEYYESIGRLFI